jgi:hypothetical protein
MLRLCLEARKGSAGSGVVRSWGEADTFHWWISDIGRTEIPQLSSLVPYRGVLSFRSEAWEGPGGEPAPVHHAARPRTGPNGLQPLYSECANSGGSTVAVAIEYRWAEGRSERHTEIADEFTRLKVNVIVTVGSAVPAAKQVATIIPIVFAAAVDPVGSGLVASLARPGGNVTGLSVQSTEVAGKRLELLREALPGLRRFAIMGNIGYPAAVLELGEVQRAASKLGLEVDTLEIRRAEDIVPAFGALQKRSASTLCVP